MTEKETRVTIGAANCLNTRIDKPPKYTAIEWFTCAICGARQDVGWKHDSPYGPLCPNCWRFHENDNGCMAREKYRYNSILKQGEMTPLDRAELDKDVLGVLKTYPRRRYYPGQIVKLILRKKLNYHNSDIPYFFKWVNRVRDSLHRLERVGKAACERPGRLGRSKRWRLPKCAENKEFSTTVI